MGEADARRLALRWLGLRALTRRELLVRLQRAGVGEPESTLDALQRQGWQSDQAVAHSERDRAQRRREGPLRLAHRLRQRGVDEGLIRDTVSAVDPDAWWEQAWREAERMGPGEGQRARLARRLARQGYPVAIIARVLDRLGQENPDGG
ncbi:MAG: RecX family transcriptional regulator [Thermaerobacter sp.]|nr:RecX family transcriptional regulator [Thermaerobacter sp.]